MVWITCVLLWCFYQLFGLSFWRHPFTAEHPLMSKWCNATFLQIWWRKTHLHLGCPEGEYILAHCHFWVNYSLKLSVQITYDWLIVTVNIKRIHHKLSEYPKNVIFKYLKTHQSSCEAFESSGWVSSLHLLSGSWTCCPESQTGSEPIDSCNTCCSSKSTKASVSAYRGKVSQSNKEELWGQRSRTRLTFCVGERWREYYREIHGAVDFQSIRTTRKWTTLHCFTLIYHGYGFS